MEHNRYYTIAIIITVIIIMAYCDMPFLGRTCSPYYVPGSVLSGIASAEALW